MDVLHIERLLYYRKYSLCGLELHERSDWRVTSKTTKLTYLMTVLLTHQMTALLPTYDALFHKNKVVLQDLRAAAVNSVYLHIAMSFRL